MIKSLKIQNLESHKNSFLEFCPGLNIIIGESDKGKSGMFRAYELLTQNSPGGDWCRPLYWEGDTIIAGEFVDPNVTVKRIRTKYENSYVLNNEAPINAGTSVPEKIATLLDLDQINLQTQIERAFLMHETAGERGRILNRIAGLDEIETTLDNARSDVSRLDKLWKGSNATIEQKEKELVAFADFEEMEAKLLVVDANQQELDKSKRRLSKLTKIADDFEEVKNALVVKESLLACEDTLERAKANVQAVSALQSRVNKLTGLAGNYGRIQGLLAKENYDGIDEKFQAIRVKQREYSTAYARAKRLKKIVSDYSIINQEIEQAEAELADLQSKIPNVCTECGREL